MHIFGSPKEESESKEPRQSHTPDRSDRLWARNRRLEARVSNLEAMYSALRRDVNRIEKAQSRARIASLPNPQPNESRPTDPFAYLFPRSNNG